MKFRGTYDLTSAPEVSGMKFPNTSARTKLTPELQKYPILTNGK